MSEPELTRVIMFSYGANDSAMKIWATADPKVFVVERRKDLRSRFVEQVVEMDAPGARAAEIIAEANRENLPPDRA